MLNLWNRKSTEREVTLNPYILFDQTIDAGELKVHGLGLMDPTARIERDEVATTTFEPAPLDAIRFPNGHAKRKWTANKVFYESDEGLKEHVLQDRIAAVLDHGGILHMNSGAKYVVQLGMVVGVGIHGRLAHPYKKLTKRMIEKRFGIASRFETDNEEVEGAPWTTRYFYEHRNMLIIYSEPDRAISAINIGLFPLPWNPLAR